MFSPISYLLAPAIVTGKLYNEKFKLHFILLLSEKCINAISTCSTPPYLGRCRCRAAAA